MINGLKYRHKKLGLFAILFREKQQASDMGKLIVVIFAFRPPPKTN